MENTLFLHKERPQLLFAETIIISHTCNENFGGKHDCGVRKINYVLPRGYLCAAKINHNSVTVEID